MAIHEVLKVLDAEIERLLQARSLIAADAPAEFPTPIPVSFPTPAPVAVINPHKRGPKPKAAQVAAVPAKHSKHAISEEGRKAIGEAVRARWAKKKKEARAAAKAAALKAAPAKKQPSAAPEA
jgi:hypothetical protein